MVLVVISTRWCYLLIKQAIMAKTRWHFIDWSSCTSGLQEGFMITYVTEWSYFHWQKHHSLRKTGLNLRLANVWTKSSKTILGIHFQISLNIKDRIESDFYFVMIRTSRSTMKTGFGAGPSGPMARCDHTCWQQWESTMVTLSFCYLKLKCFV